MFRIIFSTLQNVTNWYIVCTRNFNLFYLFRWHTIAQIHVHSMYISYTAFEKQRLRHWLTFVHTADVQMHSLSVKCEQTTYLPNMVNYNLNLIQHCIARLNHMI